LVSVYNVGMNNKTYFKVTGLVFLIVFVLHALRLFKGWEVSVGGTMLPMAVSYVGLVVAGCLAYYGLKAN
jgi:hypothetical protein